jgi:bifunctional DNase/RNase
MNCDAGGCKIQAIFHFTHVQSRHLVLQNYFCDEHAREYFITKFRSSAYNGSGEPKTMTGHVCVDFETIIYHDGPEDTPACIYLGEVGGTRRFCVRVNGWAWWSLMAQIKEQEGPRPLTHAAWSATIAELGGVFDRSIVDALDEIEGRFTAKVHVSRGSELKSIGIQLSDALILTLIHGAPVFVAESVFAKVADRN